MLQSVKIAKRQARMSERVDESKREWSARTGLPESMWTIDQQSAAYEAAAGSVADEGDEDESADEE